MAVADRPLFIAHDKLSQWESEGKVTFTDNILTLIAEKRKYSLVVAVRFLRVVGDDPDVSALVGKVRTRDQLKTLGAEHMMGSVILKDTAYEVQEGFVGTALPLDPPAPRPAAPRPAPAPAAAPAVTPPVAAAQPTNTSPSIADALGGSSTKSAPSDAELLANFLLDNLAG